MSLFCGLLDSCGCVSLGTFIVECSVFSVEPMKLGIGDIFSESLLFRYNMSFNPQSIIFTYVSGLGEVLAVLLDSSVEPVSSHHDLRQHLFPGQKKLPDKKLCKYL